MVTDKAMTLITDREGTPILINLAIRSIKKRLLDVEASREVIMLVIPSLKRDYRPLEIYRVAFIELQFPNVVVKMKRISTI